MPEHWVTVRRRRRPSLSLADFLRSAVLRLRTAACDQITSSSAILRRRPRLWRIFLRSAAQCSAAPLARPVEIYAPRRDLRLRTSAPSAFGSFDPLSGCIFDLDFVYFNTFLYDDIFFYVRF